MIKIKIFEKKGITEKIRTRVNVRTREKKIRFGLKEKFQINELIRILGVCKRL